MTLRVESLASLKQFLRNQLEQEAREYFGISDESIVEQVTDNWFEDERNYDGRWALLQGRGLARGRILDMAAGCGSFLLYALRQGCDAYGVEPEAWKLAYFGEKVRLSGLPGAWQQRMVRAVGERLPFPDASFDLVTSYQTLEHVEDARTTLYEMLRVLRPGGSLYLRAPDYDSWFEPHYRLPFLPRMDKRLARRYLRALGRPLRGLDTLNWTSTREVIAWLRSAPCGTSWTSQAELRLRRRFDALPLPFRPLWHNRSGWVGLRGLAAAAQGLRRLWELGRRERNIDLWIRLDATPDQGGAPSPC